jgi:hypothetical protein
MPLFASLEDIAAATLGDLQQIARDDAGCRRLRAYWTPERGQLLSVYEGESARPPVRGDARPEVFPVLPITAEEYGPTAMEPAAGEGAGLQLVLVRRRLQPTTRQNFRAVALQAIMCAYEYTDLRWLRSYWATEENELHCVFRTRTHDLVREHARRSRIPCDEVHDAVELGPDLTAMPAAVVG